MILTFYSGSSCVWRRLCCALNSRLLFGVLTITSPTVTQDAVSLPTGKFRALSFPICFVQSSTQEITNVTTTSPILSDHPEPGLPVRKTAPFAKKKRLLVKLCGSPCGNSLATAEDTLIMFNANLRYNTIYSASILTFYELFTKRLKMARGKWLLSFATLFIGSYRKNLSTLSCKLLEAFTQKKGKFSSLEPCCVMN